MDNKKYVEQTLKTLKELDELNELETIITDNKIEFVENKNTFRVRLPNQREKKELQRLQSEKYIELLQNEKYLLRNALIEVYKKQNIDIVKMDDEIIENQKQQEDLLERLAPLSDKQSVDLLKDKIIDLRKTQSEVSQQKNEYLSYCIEQQVVDYLNLYSNYLLLEVQINDKWKRYFDEYDQFLEAGSEKENLLTKSSYYLSMLVMRNVLSL